MDTDNRSVQCQQRASAFRRRIFGFLKFSFVIWIIIIIIIVIIVIWIP